MTGARICLECFSRTCTHVMPGKRALHLTPRELDIVRALAEGHGEVLKEIANRLGMTTGTLKSHLGKIYTKFGWGGPSSRMQLTLWAHDHRGLLNPVPPHQQVA